MREINSLIIHCSDSPQGRGDNAQTIDRWHKQRGWKCIGYHYVILEDGTVETGRPIEDAGAHTVGFKGNSIGVCLIGKDSFTDEQYMSLTQLVIGMMEQFDISSKAVKGHRDLNENKECPCFSVKHFMKNYVLGD